MLFTGSVIHHYSGSFAYRSFMDSPASAARNLQRNRYGLIMSNVVRTSRVLSVVLKAVKQRVDIRQNVTIVSVETLDLVYVSSRSFVRRLQCRLDSISRFNEIDARRLRRPDRRSTYSTQITAMAFNDEDMSSRQQTCQ